MNAKSAEIRVELERNQLEEITMDCRYFTDFLIVIGAD